MKSLDDKLEQLRNFYESIKVSSLVFATGDKGFGKTSVINRFLSDKPHIVRVNNHIRSSYYLEPIVTALNSYQKRRNPLENIIDEKNMNLGFPEKVMHSILSICHDEPIILYFEEFNTFDCDLMVFCKELTSLLISEFSEQKHFVVVELDSDDDMMQSYSEVIEKLYSITTRAFFLNFSRIDSQELRQSLFESCNSKLEIRQKDMEYILSSSCGNLMHFTFIISFLKQKGYLVLKKEGWVCKELPKGIFSQVVKKYVLARYEKLDEHLKTVLLKSSIIGYEFTTQLLETSFKQLQAGQDLSRIESVSKLIYEKEDNTLSEQYLFESSETYNTVKDLIQETEKFEWSILLARYFTLQLQQSAGLPMEKRIGFCIKAASYYENGCDFEKALTYYLKAITLSMNLMDYSQALILIEKAQKINRVTGQDIVIKCKLYDFSAQCDKYMGRYGDACEKYRYCLSCLNYADFADFQELQYELAYCLYYVGADRIDESLHILLALKDERKQSSRNSLLMYKVISLLSSIYAFMRNYGIAGKYFDWSVKQCKKSGFEREYYIQLRKATMHIDAALTRPMMLEAANYFQRIHDIKEYAKVQHNLGTDSLYLGDTPDAIARLSDAINTFLLYGSNDIKYSYNCCGVYEAVYAGNMSSAICTFQKALSYDIDKFTRLVLTINMASCYCALGDTEKCRALLDESDTIRISCKECNIPSYSLYGLFNKGIYYKAIGDLEKSLNFFYEVFKHCPNNNQLYLASRHIADICTLAKKPVSDEIEQHCHIIAQPLYQRYYELGCMFSTLRFWE